LIIGVLRCVCFGDLLEQTFPTSAFAGSQEKGTIMNKKTMLLALAVAAVFALPSAASAQEIHFKNVTSFTGSGPASTFTAANEPKISCTSSTVTGSFESGSTTTGTYHALYHGCTAEFLGIKGSCNTAGSPSGTITAVGTFHIITTPSNKPATLYTWKTTTNLCIGFSRVEVTGNGVIGTITSPACGASSKEMKVSLEAEGSTQKHIEYTGTKYDLSADTENEKGETTGANGTAALSGSATLSSATTGTLECT
jgi:hypothetical protein